MIINIEIGGETLNKLYDIQCYYAQKMKEDICINDTIEILANREYLRLFNRLDVMEVVDNEQSNI